VLRISFVGGKLVGVFGEELRSDRRVWLGGEECVISLFKIGSGVFDEAVGMSFFLRVKVLFVGSGVINIMVHGKWRL